MSITAITPRMQTALEDGKPILYFADLWLRVLNDIVDTQADWEAASADSNMDYTSAPGQARLATAADLYTITQSSDNTNFTFDLGDQTVLIQGFTITVGRKLSSLDIKFHNTGGDAAGATISIIRDLSYITVAYDVYWSELCTVLAQKTQGIPAAADTTYTIDFGGLYLAAGQYYIMVQTGSTVHTRYQNTDVYDGGQMDYAEVTEGAVYPDVSFIWTKAAGDLWFELVFDGFEPTGYTTTKTIDLGEAPPSDGTFQMSYEQPAGTELTITLSGSSTGAFAGEETSYPFAADGQAVDPFRYWRVRLDLMANSELSLSPSIDMVEFLFPKERLLLREDRPLANLSGSLVTDYQPLMESAEISSSEIKVLERLSSGGTATLRIADPAGDTVRLAVSGSALKNYRCILSIGCDVPGFVEADLLRSFIGIVETAEIRPRFRGGTDRLDLKLRNPILEMTRKVPLPTSTGSVDLTTIAVSYDGTHVLDAALDLLRAQAQIPARYINLESITGQKASIGDAALEGAAYIVRRSVTPVDTRLKSPEEVKAHLAALAVIADGYWIVDEAGKIAFVRHDTAAAAEAAWADEDLVRDGADAVAIQDIQGIKLGYDDLLFNTCIMGAGWDGSGTDWTAFDVVYGNVNADSAAEFSPGEASTWSLLEKNMKEASKWLDNADGYNGDIIANALSARYVDRFGYPPLRLVGVAVPVSQFLRTLGSVVTVASESVYGFNRVRIPESEGLKFLVTKKTYDRGRNRMLFDLIELK